MSSVGSVNHNMAKFLVKILQPISVNQYSCRDTHSFVNDIKGLKFGSSFICSFDVESLFTNVPVKETIDICCQKLYHDTRFTTPDIPEKLFREMLERCATNTPFLFNNCVYKQIDGVSMGSPLGPVLANIFLCHLEETYMLKHPTFPSFYRRYVDDTFAVFPTKQDALNFFEFINGIHGNIRFTMESEKDGSLQFLDTVVQKHNDVFDLDMFHKPTETGLYLSWSSLIPKVYKISLIKCLTHRILVICSKAELIKKTIGPAQIMPVEKWLP